MGMNQPIIAAEQVGLAEVRSPLVRITNVLPPGSARAEDPVTGQVVEISQVPVREGQMIIYRAIGSSNVQMLVAIDIENVLQWRYVLSAVRVLNNGTGRDWDPNAHFYTGLAN